MALLVFPPAPAGAGVVAADLLALAAHRLHLGIVAAVRFLRLRRSQGRARSGKQLAGVVEGEVPGHGARACQCKLTLWLLRAYVCLLRATLLSGARAGRGTLGSSSAAKGGHRRLLLAAAFIRLRWRRHRLIQEHPAQDLLVDAVHEGLEHRERLFLVLDQRIAL